LICVCVCQLFCLLRLCRLLQFSVRVAY
jgi:hypothetical protein